MSGSVQPISSLSRKFFFLSVLRLVLLVFWIFSFFLFPASTFLVVLAIYLYVSIVSFRVLNSIFLQLKAGGE